MMISDVIPWCASPCCLASRLDSSGNAYQLSVTFAGREEQHIRILLLQAVASEALILKALRSEDIGDGIGRRSRRRVVGNHPNIDVAPV